LAVSAEVFDRFAKPPTREHSFPVWYDAIHALMLVAEIARH
jgi:hypothetical protein